MKKGHRQHHTWCSRNRQICSQELISKSISESLEPRKCVKIAAFNWFISLLLFSVFWEKNKTKRIARWKQRSTKASTNNDLRPLHTLSDVKRISSVSYNVPFTTICWYEKARASTGIARFSQLIFSADNWSDLGNLTGGVQQAYHVTICNTFKYWALKSSQTI